MRLLARGRRVGLRHSRELPDMEASTGTRLTQRRMERRIEERAHGSRDGKTRRSGYRGSHDRTLNLPLLHPKLLARTLSGKLPALAGDERVFEMRGLSLGSPDDDDDSDGEDVD